MKKGDTHIKENDDGELTLLAVNSNGHFYTNLHAKMTSALCKQERAEDGSYFLIDIDRDEKWGDKRKGWQR